MNTIAGLSLTSDSPGSRLFMLGNEAIARGAVEAGARVVAAYPGTPSTEIVETLLNHRRDLDMYIEWSTNEKVAFGLAFGAALCGARGMAVMKHVGINVALDSIMTAAYIGTPGGLVLVEAEDPGQWSSQNEQDNRYIAEQGYIPVLEPSSAQEAKDMTVDAFRLSEKYGQMFMIRSVTRIGHSRSDVTLGEILKTSKKYRLNADPDRLVMLPAVARKHRRLVVSRLARIKEEADLSSWNRLSYVNNAQLGIIASGIAYSYVIEALNWLNLKERVSVLKIGMPYPLPEKMIQKMLQLHTEILVAEELEPFIENHVRVIAQKSGLQANIHGKDVLPLIGEFSIRKITEALVKLTGSQSPVDFETIDLRVKEIEPLLPVRPPTMCAGCPHRASHFIIKTVCDRIRQETGIEPVRPGDIGCNCLGVHPPLNAIDISTCMGGGFDLSNGIARVTDRPIIAHLGDSTFFHSGMAPMVNAVYNQTKITMVVLDNLTTAMTGSQPSPSNGINSQGNTLDPVRPEEIARACGIKFVEVVDPHDLEKSAQILEKAVKFDGPSFVVFRSPCILLETRAKKARGEKVIPFTVDQGKCLISAPPPCTATCPLHIDARGYVKLIRNREYEAALKLIEEKLPFPGIMGRICTRPCEGQCKRGEVDESIAIAALKRSAADNGKTGQSDEFIDIDKPQKVAVVGGGPAGLMAAYDLRKMGYGVTIFEALPELGGMLTAGIPEYRLPRAVSRNEISKIFKPGIEVKLNTRVGRDIRLNDIRNQFNAVFIATGAHLGKRLDIGQGEVKGIIDGIDFLRDVNLGKGVLGTGRVVIIGGGNVAIDCARTCVRSGFKEVSVVYRRSRNEMPAIKEEVNEAEKEGVKFIFLSNPVRCITSTDQIRGLECQRMKPGKPDSSGRARPEPIQGSYFTIETDMIISAIGERPDLSFMDGFMLSTDDNLIKADPKTLATDLPGVFAGGDAVSGPGTVIEALASGRKAAVSIDRYLQGKSLEADRDDEEPQTSPLKINTFGIAQEKRASMPRLPVENRLNNMNEVDLGLSCEQSVQEASRCLSCGCEICIRSIGCPAISIENGQVSIDRGQCSGCGLCAQICPAKAIVQKN